MGRGAGWDSRCVKNTAAVTGNVWILEALFFVTNVTCKILNLQMVFLFHNNMIIQ
jgi:hypothetical protein